MSNTRVTKLLVSKDVAVSTSGLTPSTIVDGSIVAFKKDNVQLGSTDDISDSDSIFIMQGVTSSTTGVGPNASSVIKGTAVRSYLGDRFRPAANQITYIGLAPSATTTFAAGTGSIVVNADTEYGIAILNKAEKTVRQVPRRYYYVTPSDVTELSLANAFVTAINADTDAFVVARTVGNGTGTDGLTGATAYGIQLVGLTANDYFSVGVNGGFEDTPITNDFDWFVGNNTFDQMTALEQISQGNFGYYNRIWMPKTITSFITEQDNSQLTSTSASGTITFTQNSKAVTTGTGDITETLRVGDGIDVAGTTYYIADVTLAGSNTASFVLNEPFRGSTVTITASSSDFSTASIAKLEGYNTIIIEHDATFSRPETDGYAARPETTVIAIPSFLAQSTALSTIQTCLDSYMASVPGAFAGAGL